MRRTLSSAQSSKLSAGAGDAGGGGQRGGELAVDPVEERALRERSGGVIVLDQTRLLLGEGAPRRPEQQGQGGGEAGLRRRPGISSSARRPRR